MKKLLFPLSVLMLLVTACQKEISSEDTAANPGGGAPVSSGLLKRSVFVAGGDSVATNFEYDASKRLVTYTKVSTGGGNDFKRIVRNAAGIVTKYVTKSDDLASVGIDSLESFVTYDNSLNRYKHTVSTVSLAGVAYKDSTVFAYDGSGNLTTKTSFAQAGPTTYEPYRKTEYTFASGNVTSEKYYSASASGGWDLDATFTYTYDNKLNPVKLGAEAFFVLDDGTFFSTNNVATMGYTDADPTLNFSLATTYTYNAANKPAGGTTVESPGSGSYTLRYYYN